MKTKQGKKKGDLPARPASHDRGKKGGKGQPMASWKKKRDRVETKVINKEQDSVPRFTEPGVKEAEKFPRRGQGRPRQTCKEEGKTTMDLKTATKGPKNRPFAPDALTTKRKEDGRLS